MFVWDNMKCPQFRNSESYFIVVSARDLPTVLNSGVSLNLKKTKEMVIDLRIMKSEIPVITIDNTPIERVQSHKLLGIWLQSDLKWHTNTFFIIKKGQETPIFFKGVKEIWRTSKRSIKVLLFSDSIGFGIR
jgi:hypothetical protein